MVIRISAVLLFLGFALVSVVDGREDVHHILPSTLTDSVSAPDGTLDQLSIARFENGLWRARLDHSDQQWAGRLQVHLPDGTLVADVTVPRVDSSARWYEGVFFQAPEGAETLLIDDGTEVAAVSASPDGASALLGSGGDVPALAGSGAVLSGGIDFPLRAASGFLAVELESRPGFDAQIVDSSGSPVVGFAEIMPGVWLWYGDPADAPRRVSLRLRIESLRPDTTPVRVKLTDQHHRVIHTSLRLNAVDDREAQSPGYTALHSR